MEWIMQNLASRALVTALLVVVAIVPTTSVQARGTKVFGNGPIIIQGPVECEKKLVQKCRWEGDRKICEWVPSTECEIY
jgi:hypothetical protein